jgi:hypothetical protein
VDNVASLLQQLIRRQTHVPVLDAAWNSSASHLSIEVDQAELQRQAEENVNRLLSMAAASEGMPFSANVL